MVKLQFTQLFQDPLNGPNQNPLNATKWFTFGGLPGTDQLEVLGNECVTTVAVQSDGIAQNIAIPWPSNQYAQFILKKLTANGVTTIYLRSFPGTIAPMYRLFISGPFGDNTGISNYVIDQLAADGHTVAFTWAGNIPLEFNVGDTITFAVIGQEADGALYFLQNGNLIFTAPLSQSPAGVIPSGNPTISIDSLSGPPGIQSDAAITNFSGGLVALVPPVSGTITRDPSVAPANGQIIPLTSSPNQDFAVSLQVDGAPLSLNLVIAWSAMAGYWVMSIFDANGDLLLDSIPLITGYYPAGNLLAQYEYLKIGSAFIINNGNTNSDYPGQTDLGTSFSLLWGDTPNSPTVSKATPGSGGGEAPVSTSQYGEVPAGAIPGSVFTLEFTPNPAASLVLVRNGQVQLQGPPGQGGAYDYTLDGNVITYTNPMKVGETHIAYYVYILS